MRSAAHQPLQELDLRGSGDPFSAGVAYGRRAAVRVERTVAFYRRLLPAMFGTPWQEITRRAEVFDRVSAARAPDVHAFLAGVADGSGMAPIDIAAVTARSELMALALAPAGECTAVVGPTSIGQNWDWFVAQQASCVIVRTDRWLAFTEAGMPAKVGLNRHGLAITLNFMSTTDRPDAGGLPIHVAITALLDAATSVDHAIDMIGGIPIACSAALGLLDASGAACFVELTPRRRAVVRAAPGSVHTNHCVARSLVGADLEGALLRNSAARLRRARQLVAVGEPIEKILADTQNASSALDIDAPVGGAALAIGTVASIVIDVGGRRLLIAPGRPSRAGFSQTVSW